MRAVRCWCVLAVAASVALAGCTSRPEDTVSRPYPHRLVASLADLRQESGLFARPGAGQTALSLYSSALFKQAGALSGPFRLDASDAAPEEATVVTPTLYTWSFVYLAGGTPEHPIVLPDRDGLTTDVPGATGDEKNDIGLLWAWVDTASRLTPSPSRAVVQQVADRLSAVNPGALESPYLLWRLSAAYGLMRATPPAALGEAVARVTRPARLDSIPAVLDLEGFLGLQVQLHRPVSAALGLAEEVRKRLNTTPADDDLSRAALLRSLTLLGQSDAEATAAVQKRRDSSTGLVRQVPTVAGSVETTYLVASLVPQDFAAIAGETTRAGLRRFLGRSGDATALDRLEAIAALKLSGDETWRNYRSEVAEAEAALRDHTVTENELPAVIRLVGVLRHVSASVPQPRLGEFTVDGGDDEYLARLALGNHDMFANSDEIRTWFPSVQARLIAASVKPAEPLRLYYAGLQALSGASRLSLSQGDRATVEAALAPLRGCVGSPDLYRSSAADSSSCSLEATRIAIDSGFAYGGDDDG